MFSKYFVSKCCSKTIVGRMEKDDEVKGEGNSYTTEFRQYDPRLGRWLSLDPLMMEFPWMSPYVAFDNNPVYFVDPYGLKSEEGGDKGKKDDKGSGEGDKSTSEEGAKPGVDDTGLRPEGLPNDPVDGSIYEAKNGKKYQYIVDDEGNGSFIGTKNLESVTIYDTKVVKSKSYGWLDGVSLGGFDFTSRRKVSMFHDDLKSQTPSVQADWTRNRANVDAVNDFVNSIMLNVTVTGLTLGTAPGLSFGGRFLFGSASNSFNQLAYYKFDYKQIDVTNVIASGLTNGLIPNVYSGGMKPLIRLVSVNAVDAAFDYTAKNKLNMVFDGSKPLGQAGVDFGFGVAGGAIPSASPLIPYQIQMMPSSFMLYGINYGVNTVNFPSK
jgi:RHS repeat-associated protein